MSEEKTVIKKEAQAPKRQRNPINGTRTKLTLTGEEPGFHYCWVNDENVGTYEDWGYEFVTHAIKVGNRHVDVSEMQGSHITRAVGQGVVAHLMRIPQEFYDADMEAHQRDVVDMKEEQIRRDINSNGLSGSLVIGQRAWDEPTPDIKYKK